jgi:hypothetical protein
MVNILTKELQGYERKLGEIRLLPSATGEVVQ